MKSSGNTRLKEPETRQLQLAGEGSAKAESKPASVLKNGAGSFFHWQGESRSESESERALVNG